MCPSRGNRGSVVVNTVARYIVASEIPTTQSLRVGNAVRAALMSLDGAGDTRLCVPTLAGKDASGVMLKGHQHAFYLPTDESGDHKIDHVTVSAPGGLCERSCDALTALDWIVVGGVQVPVELIGIGSSEHFDAPLFAESHVWQSVTPFLLTRHPKYYRNRKPRLKESDLRVKVREVVRAEHYGVFGARIQRDCAVDQLCRQLDRMHGVDLEDIESVTLTDNCLNVNPWSFLRLRKNLPATDRPFGFEFQLKRKIRGPVVLGYACHQGLGLFVPGFGLYALGR